MSRPLFEVIAHIRAVAANPAISTTLIQTEDLEALCSAAETLPLDATKLRSVVSMFGSPTIGRGDIHGGISGVTIYEDEWPRILAAVNDAVAQERLVARCKACGNPRPGPDHKCPAR
jgi:hypothetical protein